MSIGSESVEALRAQLSQQASKIVALEADRDMLIQTSQAVYAYLVEPNPKNNDPAPWDLVDNDHPIRVAATRIVDTLVSLGVEA